MRHLLITVFVLFLSALASSCRMGGIEQTGGAYPEPGRLSGQVTLLNWNAHKNLDEQLAADLKDALNTHRPDLVFLQEATGRLSRTSPVRGVFARSWKYPWLGGKTVGVLTASTVRPMESVPLPTRHREFAVTAPKMSLATRYPLEDGRELLAVNVHCLNFERWSTHQLRTQLVDLGVLVRAHGGPIILSGDFNTWNRKRYELVQTFVQKLNLKEVELGDDVKTGDQGAPWLNWLLGIDPSLALDRVFYRGLTLKTARVLDYQSSDHSAILASFLIEMEGPS